MTRQPLSPEATEALHEHMRTACEWLEQRKAERDADKLAEQVGRLADEMGANI